MTGPGERRPDSDSRQLYGNLWKILFAGGEIIVPRIAGNCIFVISGINNFNLPSLMKCKLYSVFFFIAVIALPASGQGINRLWGLTPAGGNPGLGTMFSTDGAGRNLVTHMNFPQGIPGEGPEATRLLAYNGSFYGMTSSGGLIGGGVLFSWDPVQMKYINHHYFQPDGGSYPLGSLVEKDGKLYGMTSEGGENSGGVIFSWDPAGSVYTKLFDFSDALGKIPLGSLTLAGGKFYGMTSGGGANDDGVIFEWDPVTGSYVKLFDFSDADGTHPEGDLFSQGGKLYGMTAEGGQHGHGVIFEWDNGTYSLLHHFDEAHGSYPTGSLTAYDNKLFGMTSKGGTGDGGVLFELDNGSFTVRYEFSEAGGHHPLGTPEVKGDKLYGLTSEGGANEWGVIFEWDPATSTYTPRHEFEESTGWNPRGSMLLAGGKFFGLTYAGGSIDSGVLFEWDPDGGSYTDRTNFSDGLVTGVLPMSNVTFLDGKLFATTALDLLAFGGSIFEWDPEKRQYTARYTFRPEDEMTGPYGELIEKDGKFYGLTLAGGAHDGGVIFEWDPVTEALTKRCDLPEGFGSRPGEGFLLLNGKFYGVSSSYGQDEENSESSDGIKGIFFEWDPDANGGSGQFTERYLFNSASPENGLLPAGIVVKDGKIYGITSAGGAHGNGTIFEWDPALNIFTNKLDLEIANGKEVMYLGAMTLKNGIFYGTALIADPVEGVEKGILFAWNPETNVFTTEFDFTNADGAWPATMLSVNNGKLYGMANTGCGCESESGFIYEWDPAKARFTKGADLDNNAQILPGLFLPFTRLVPVPVPVSEGQPGTCMPLTVTIDASNSDEWVPVTDADGNAVAEINANGNELGDVLVSVYVNDGPVRQDGGKRLYLDRNITITPNNPSLQPGTEVGIRLYIRAEEYDALANARNSDDQPSGIAGINDLGLFKNESDNCNSTLHETAAAIEAVAETWNKGYVLQTSISTFSTFFFASSEHSALPVRLVSFRAGIEDTNGVLSWQTAEETGFSHIEVERSLDGRAFAFIGRRAARGTENGGRYTFVDPGVTEKAANTVYYRLKLVDTDGSSGYSKILAADISRGTSPVYVYPNPAVETLHVRMKNNDEVRWQIVDLSGRKVKSGDESGAGLQIGVRDLPPGIYHLILTGQQNRETFRFVKR